MKRINPNAVREGDYVEAHFPCGCVEHGVAALEEKTKYSHRRTKRRMLLRWPGYSQVITGCAGFPAGTVFYRLTSEEQMAVEHDGTWPTASHCHLADV